MLRLSSSGPSLFSSKPIALSLAKLSSAGNAVRNTIVVWNNLLQLLLCFCLATQILLKHVCEEKTARDS